MHLNDTPIYIGIAGWSYPDWDGYVYPGGTRDRLRYVAEYVDVVEINSTFYRPPDSATALSWLRRTIDLPDFRFTAKLHQDITHRGRLEPETTLAFHRAFGPHIDEEKFSHFLAQFRYDFADVPGNRHHVQAVANAYGRIAQVAVEMRHGSWQSPDALQFLDGLGVSVVNLDYPAGRDAFNLRNTRIGSHAYFRLHGRNTAAWFAAGAARNSAYDYLYQHRELDEIVQRAREIAETSQSLTIVANNHFQGKELVNALEMKALMQKTPPQIPPLLAQRYPNLRA